MKYFVIKQVQKISTSKLLRLGMTDKLNTKSTCECVTWCFSNRASWIDYILITNLMH